MQLINENLKLLDQEETYWFSRCHEQWLLKEDNNTSYFHRIANGRKRKNAVISLECDGSIIEGDENLLKHATEYYSNLFGPDVEHNIRMDRNVWHELEQVSDQENEFLWWPFSESEVKEALFQMEKNKVAGPDKIPIEFYQMC
jgi:hypothetical protein